jgi:hypothetical protein
VSLAKAGDAKPLVERRVASAPIAKRAPATPAEARKGEGGRKAVTDGAPLGAPFPSLWRGTRGRPRTAGHGDGLPGADQRMRALAHGCFLNPSPERGGW